MNALTAIIEAYVLKALRNFLQYGRIFNRDGKDRWVDYSMSNHRTV
jgi:hypothetical protein